ncbi:MurR/RpiR family transcriptional regulator [Rhodospirillaceae bacterium SYSU D60014]|uniref:MurR/RpiR family transcriptional regulator n=1 Tax=Virgifigura deserti TaxID=2268457 RepID=UPI0013C4A446
MADAGKPMPEKAPRSHGRARGRRTGLKTLEETLRKRSHEFTPAERAIAAYLRENFSSIPFETGASIATSAGVSEMSVIRFIRSLGFANLRELKDRLRASYPEEEQIVDDVLDRFQVRHDDVDHLRTSLELELCAVLKAYELVATDRWQKIVDLLTRRRFIHVAGFQATKGTALDFANRLKYARSGVRFAEGSAGTYSEVLESDPKESCLVLVDTVAYARRAPLLARKAKEMGLPVVIVTDRFSHWAYEFTDLVLEGYTHVKTFWDSTASLNVILNLLINSVAARLGAKAEDRFRLLGEFGDYFQEFERVRRPNGNGRNRPHRQQR